MRIFVDMDGTLAKWNNVEFEQLFEQGYYRNLEPNAALVAEVRGLIQNGNDVYILSAYLTESDYAYQEKLDWLDEHIHELTAEKTILLPYGENKAAYLKEHYSPIAHDDVLIDDYTQNLLEWRDYGGEGIKYLNGINHTRGTWQGVTIGENAPTLTETIQAFRSDAERMNGLLASGDMSFRYQLLDRLRSDCDYFLGNGGAQDKFLWGSNIHSHIYFMRGLWNSFPENAKPEWLSLPDINKYEHQMNSKANTELSQNPLNVFLSSVKKDTDEKKTDKGGFKMDDATFQDMIDNIIQDEKARSSVRSHLEGKKAAHDVSSEQPTIRKAGEPAPKKDNLDGMIAPPSTDNYSR